MTKAKRKACELIDSGHGYKSLAKELGVPAGIAREWVWTYRAVGLDGLLNMGSSHRGYDYETKLAAARDYVENGLSCQETMAKHCITNATQVTKWAKKYREGGPEALRPKRRGRPKGARNKPAQESREEMLEERVHKLEAEIAYLKKLGP